MPIKNPYKSTSSIKVIQSAAFKKTAILIMFIMVAVYASIGVYTSVIVPSVVAESLETNIKAVNTVSLYTKEFEKEILTNLSSGEIDSANKSVLTAELDKLSSKVVESKNSLSKGSVEDTKQFYESVYSSLESFQTLLISTRSYISYQYCFLDLQKELINSYELKSTILASFDSVTNLYDQPDLYNQLISVYTLVESVYNQINTCFGPEFGYLQSEQVNEVIKNYRSYIQTQISILTTAYNDAINKDQIALETRFAELASNERNSDNFFDNELYVAVKYQPLELIRSQNTALEDQYTTVSQNLKQIKSKYNLS